MNKKIVAIGILVFIAAAAFADWPDNEAMRQIPKPPFNAARTNIDTASRFDVMTSGMTAANFRAYKQTLKRRGFSKVAEDTEDNSMGFQFTASNASGWNVEMAFYPNAPGGQGTLAVYRTPGSTATRETANSTSSVPGQVTVQNKPKGVLRVVVGNYSGAIANEDQAVTAEDDIIASNDNNRQTTAVYRSDNGLPFDEDGVYAVRVMQNDTYEERFFAQVRFTKGGATVDRKKPSYTRAGERGRSGGRLLSLRLQLLD